MTKEGEYTYGFESLTNSGDAPLQIEQVSLVDPADVSIVDSFVAPIEKNANGKGTLLIGVVKGWDLTDEVKSGDLTPAADATVSSGQQASQNLVLHLTARPGASFKAMQVHYRYEGSQFRRTSTVSVKFAAKC
ncbi:hypothetical protein [Janibacter sp. UYMM211]|uniref:hypothetical protein n=1 Tax=Janibacter sp. UYMM211 TaxID=3156342 RepID=UPI00339824F4